MTDVLWLVAALAAVAWLIMTILSWRARRHLVAQAMMVLGLVGLLGGALGWFVWMTSIDQDADVVSVQGDGRCRVTWIDYADRTLKEATVDCPTSGSRAVRPSEPIRIKAHRWWLHGAASTHDSPSKLLLLGWVPVVGAVVGLAGHTLLRRGKLS